MKKMSLGLLMMFFALTSLHAQHRKIDTIMKLGNVGFKLVCNNKNDDKNYVTVSPIGFSSGARDVSFEVKGRIRKAEVDDLNGDLFPDMVIYIYLNGSDDKGTVMGVSSVRMYQRNKIQEESLYYETKKHTGELPLIGVNTFLNKKGSPTVLPGEVIRSTTEEKEQQIQNLKAFKQRNEGKNKAALLQLQQVAINNGNLFEELMETVKYCTLGEITNALYQVGGQYRRNM